MQENQSDKITVVNPPHTSSLAEALSHAQGKIEAPLKTKKVDFTNKNNQRVKYNYADLADVMKAIRGPFAENGLSIIHQMGYRQYGQSAIFGLTTTLLHSAGEERTTWYPLPDPADGSIKAQEFGSALTYARRYSVSSLVGIASEEDDDGQEAAPTSPPQKKNNSTQSKPSSLPSPKPDPAANLKPRADVLKNTTVGNLRTFPIKEDDMIAKASLRDQLEAKPNPEEILNNLEFQPTELDKALESQTMGDTEPVTLLDRLVAIVKEKNIPHPEVSEMIFRITGKRQTSKQLSAEDLEKVVKHFEIFK